MGLVSGPKSLAIPPARLFDTLDLLSACSSGVSAIGLALLPVSFALALPAGAFGPSITSWSSSSPCAPSAPPGLAWSAALPGAGLACRWAGLAPGHVPTGSPGAGRGGNDSALM
eukprot:10888271-Heterocapsa_arctica.AAC.1